jgi:hypothetical protein
MIVKLLEDSSLYGLKAGEVHNIPDEIAGELISKGVAIKEQAIDHEAYNALIAAKNRNDQ